MACSCLQFFVIGHECGHRSFHENNLVEDIVGTLAFMPIIYPFEPWRIKHNHHHAHTNKCVPQHLLQQHQHSTSLGVWGQSEAYDSLAHVNLDSHSVLCQVCHSPPPDRFNSTPALHLMHLVPCPHTLKSYMPMQASPPLPYSL